MSYYAHKINAYWRPYEEDACKKHLGEEVSEHQADYILWRINTEHIDNIQSFTTHEKNLGERNIINPMSKFNYTNQKELCFSQWEWNGINCPRVFEFKNRDEFERQRFEFPFLLRLNDRSTGYATYLIRNESELDEGMSKLINEYNNNFRSSTKMICVEFIDTKVKDYNVSYRIHVAGNKVVSGYARLSEDWLAISSQFKNPMKESFVEQNKKVQTIIKDNYNQILRSVHTLGLHHQGVDVIVDKNDRLYFLEVQPFYFSGRRNIGRGFGVGDTSPPFWNPYKPQNLVDWLVEEENDLRQEIPLYYENWLNKENHFDLCYQGIKEFFDVRS
tara:strand:+ start:616 stop:1608 length:993 start_codon:yes stop_codon:yes gene_type:complete